MLRSVIVTGLVIASGAAFSTPFSPFYPAKAETKVNYTFADSCDGLSLTQKSDGTARGTHTGSCLLGDYAGGVRATIQGKSVWVIITTEAKVNSYTEMFVLDESALTWKVYLMQNQSQKFVRGASGTLIVGRPPSGVTPFGKAMKTSSGAVVVK